ncbi:MAG: alanine dehydrogenase [Oscillospiraceae bacterium]|nr:alanine dehydrogenase [Oscillospiraceae bacterium]MCL2278366.1 alanine dehydrogenase [Oscillospiraceae bacterium]
MKVGIPKEIKAQENRIAATPAGVMSFVSAGHTVFVEKDAGLGSGFSDDEYVKAGAKILSSAADVYAESDMIYKVKEPLEPEYSLIREGQIMFTFLHLAPDIPQTDALIKSKCIGIAYETVELDDGSLPLLTPMSEIAGKVAVQVGANLLHKSNDGSGILLGGLPGVKPGHVVIIGGGISGVGAARIAVGLGARVTIIDLSLPRMAYLQDLFGNSVETLFSTEQAIAKAVSEADLLVGAVLITGEKAPKLVTEEMVKSMRPGSVIVDISIDQGGIAETIDRTTSHKDPYFIKHDVVHYSVPNIPGAVPRTSTFALSNATLPYALQIANKGAIKAMQENPALRKGLSVYKGDLVCKPTAKAQNRTAVDFDVFSVNA